MNSILKRIKKSEAEIPVKLYKHYKFRMEQKDTDFVIFKSIYLEKSENFVYWKAHKDRLKGIFKPPSHHGRYYKQYINYYINGLVSILDDYLPF